MPMNMVIQERRKTLGILQEQIADYLGVSTPAFTTGNRDTFYLAVLGRNDILAAFEVAPDF